MIPNTYLIQRKILLPFLLFIIIWICLAVLEPILKYSYPTVAQYIHNIYAPVCHQIPERSFQINSFPMSFCIRCSGFYLSGALLAVFYVFRQKIRILPLYFYILLSLPLLSNFLLEKIGLYHDAIFIRFITGILLGISLFHLLIISLSIREDELKVPYGEKIWTINRS
jgi:uncharacterized membrane protein